jgi:glycosyltransferase involved in cell wall biosynthesis
MVAESSQIPYSPVVSVIIPCYKQAQYVGAAIESVLSQEYPNVEVVLVNDGSPDDTHQVAAQYEGRIIYIEQPNSGVAVSRNNGFARASGEYIKFLDADDVLTPAMLKLEMEVASKNAVDIVASKHIEVNVDMHPLREVEAPDYQADAFHKLIRGNLAPPLCFLIRRKCLDKVGGFDQKMTPHEDWDMLLRLAAAGFSFGIAPTATALYRVHPASASKNLDRMYDSALRVLFKNESSHADCAACHRAIRQCRAMQRYVYLRRNWTGLFRAQPLPERAARLRRIAMRSIANPAFFGTMMRMVLRQPARFLSAKGGKGH